MMFKLLHKISHKYASKWLVLLSDLFIVVVTFLLAYFIRFNFQIDFDINLVLSQVPYVLLAALISFIAVRSHKGVVRFTGYKDIINIIIGTNILATILIVTTFFSRKFNYDELFDIPGSIIYIHLLLNIAFIIGFKLFIKSIYNTLSNEFVRTKNVLIFGAGNSGMITYDAISNDPQNLYQVIGFVD
ncbi:MAG: polysaccharide biosynthesis protein, partial [Gelidibacter sp.]